MVAPPRPSKLSISSTHLLQSAGVELKPHPLQNRFNSGRHWSQTFKASISPQISLATPAVRVAGPLTDHDDEDDISGGSGMLPWTRPFAPHSCTCVFSTGTSIFSASATHGTFTRDTRPCGRVTLIGVTARNLPDTFFTNGGVPPPVRHFDRLHVNGDQTLISSTYHHHRRGPTMSSTRSGRVPDAFQPPQSARSEESSLPQLIWVFNAALTASSCQFWLAVAMLGLGVASRLARAD
ncbi:hypothetical protein K438DRAFT_1932636 [Mycena galopus ATCC 62051]|nr:hypothetical protein K438DRAFT_1932636 [Mycena galopus ATCC 62051]